MTLVFLVLLLALMWLANYAFGNFIKQRTKRKGFYIFAMMLALAFFILMFKILKSLFVIAIPMVILLSFMLMSRKR